MAIHLAKDVDGQTLDVDLLLLAGVLIDGLDPGTHNHDGTAGMGPVLSLSVITGSISAAQHGAQTDATLHADATPGVDGFMPGADKTKLDAIESGATADQTDAEIKTAYENNANTNEFSDAEQTKLLGIEASATADQTNAEIKTAYELNADTNAFDDAAVSKLSGIEASATADQSDAEIKTAYENNADTNEFSDAEQSKLSGAEEQTNKNAASGYAGLSAGSKLTASQMTEVMSIQGLSDVQDVLSPSNNDALVWTGSQWEAQPATATNADTVDGIHASATPTADQLIALDGQAHLLPALLDALGSISATLEVVYNSANQTFQIDVNADFLMVEGVELSSVNLTADITASGANGLDTGSEASSTWYSLWLITNDDGTLGPASLLSLSATKGGLTLPGSYTKARRVGWVRNNSSSNFLRQRRSPGDNKVWNLEGSGPRTILNTASPSASFTDLDCSAFAPPTSRVIKVSALHSQTDNNAGIDIIPRGDGDEILINRLFAQAVGASVMAIEGPIITQIDSSQFARYKASVSGTSAAKIFISYYEDNI